MNKNPSDTQEINSKEWPAFCREFTEANQGSLLTIQMIDRNGLEADIAREIPLEAVTFDGSDACNDVITFVLGKTGDRRLEHAVIEPIRIMLVKTREGSKQLQIEAENGMTLVNFHSGRIKVNGSEGLPAGNRN